ncbi:alkaline phosphatase family protein [Paenibacillus sp. 1001270B_150601_E10]|uniref:alkaline phosphatase family protein n=1 Tax=Paenibacillus sp. 1001270B_150601_E10 TaxID=2787079 RepID=UPI00189CB8A2|nr:alkaline phosphatase family protein [Paenibacillus sp. 1001270B_150601_E10]
MGKSVNRVFVLGMDGAGNFLQRSNAVHIPKAVAKQGVITYNAQTEMPTISAQCWGSMLHGVTPDKHGYDNNRAAVERFPLDSPYPSFFKAARDQHPEWTLASFTCWEPINFGLVEESIDVHKVVKDDEALTEAACEYLSKVEDVQLFYLALDGPDGAGHRYGYNTDDQLRGIETADAQLGKVLAVIEQRGWMDDSLIVFVTDHGGGGADPFNHGSDHPLDRTVFWGAVGPCVNPNANIDEVTFKDTAAVVLAALGIEQPSAWDARVPDELFQSVVSS